MQHMASPGGSNSSTAGTSSGLKSELTSDHHTPTTRNKKRSPIVTASSPGGGYDNSSGASSTLICGLEDQSSELQTLMEQRRKRRKESNRESARRSRMRKQLHLDGMAAQVATLRAENHKMLVMLERAAVGFLTLESENSVLRTQSMELQSRLRSLNEIIKCMGTACTNLDAVRDNGSLAGSNWGMGTNMMPMNMNVNVMPVLDLYQCI